MSDAPRVAVVIVSFEAREALLAGLESLRRHASTPIETVVVDNASTDGSADAVRAAHPAVRVLANAENVGFARACNQGWRASGAPVVLFLNPDAEVTSGAVEALARLLEEKPSVGAAGPRTRSADGTIQVSTGPDLSPLAERRQRKLVLGVAHRDAEALAKAEALHSREHEADWVSGSCLAVRRAALEAVSGLDERFFLYEEDADLCRRLRIAGWRVVFTPSAEVRHRLGGSMARAARRARLEYHRSHLLYYRKHNGPMAQWALRLLLAARGLADWSRAVAAGDVTARADAAALLRLAMAS
ncbi:MAG TPA: glycosyltransferase family 2 protein [Vicinamibacteria bacterium]|nr:glycosyltransferase family 2 protein [Vicinamibacteria bacterium]